MNLRIPDPQGLVAWLHDTLSPLPALHTGERWRVVETPRGLFIVGDDPVEAAGPWSSFPDLLRAVGRRRRRYPDDGPATLEVREWDGWFFRVSESHAHPFKQLVSATAEHFELVFQWWEASEGVFLSQAAWDRLYAIENALGAATWGELRRTLPPGEFSSLAVWVAEGGEWVYREDGRLWYGSERDLPEDDPEAWIRSADDPFEPGMIPGWGDGEYPDWIGAIRAQELPRSFVEAHGTGVSSFLDGSWVQFPVDRLDEMEEALLAEGYVVTARRMTADR